MKVIALVSGGKDSCYAMMKCIDYGHEIVALANLMPADDTVDELDSYMYQTVGHQIIVRYSECMGIPLFRRRIQGSSRHQKLSYRITPGDEVEDMYLLLSEVKRRIPCVNAVSSGAIASDYQRLRVENVCSRLGLVSLAFLWKQDQLFLLQEMIKNGIVAITVKVAAMGLDPAKHLGKDLASLESYLRKLNKLYGINICGEGGEYETLTLDCPLFVNARIVLDEFKVVMHSPDSIAPVGVLHPVAFHLENKAEPSSGGSDNNHELKNDKIDLLFEVIGDCVEGCEVISHTSSSDSLDVGEHTFQISRAIKDDIFSICCWLQDSRKTSSDLQENLEAVLKKIESELLGYGYVWENVLYIHLYIADMNQFAQANETYIRYITQERCPFGVPSRSTIELPLLQVGLGSAYVEVLAATDQTKNVLHVQSISSWAPSCIGPYSQATLHKEILHMAGQLGLNPSTMTLCNESLSSELEQALENSEAVANCFNCSISMSAIFFIVYCSADIPLSERYIIQEKLEAVLKQMKLLHSDKVSKSKVIDPIFLYILSPNLPKRALVEVKPVLYVPEENMDAVTRIVLDRSRVLNATYWGFQHAPWHDSCIQKCVVHQKICAAVLCVTSELARKICSDFPGSDQINEGHLKTVSRFCLYLLDKIIMENGFAWEDMTNLRIYFPTSLNVTLETLSLIFTYTFAELAEINQTFKVGNEPVFNLVPVLGAGRTAECVNDIIACELFARKS